MRMLIVEDDPSLHRILNRYLKEAGYSVDSCFDGEEAIDYLLVNEYDCVILDWMLPKKDGVSVLKDLRKNGNNAPVLMLTARDSIEDRVDGLDSGADDYLTKPFSFDELIARIRALLRRSTGQKANDLVVGDLVLHVATRKVSRGNTEINLTSREYSLLEYMMRNTGIVLSRSQIADHVWRNDFGYDSNVVDVYIRYLRKKIDKGFDRQLIQTIRGFGYVLKEENENN